MGDLKRDRTASIVIWGRAFPRTCGEGTMSSGWMRPR
jgi:hypothetical protein